MDRRTLLAFVLIFLILIGSPYLMKKLYPQPEQAPEKFVGSNPDSTLVVDHETSATLADTYEQDLSSTPTADSTPVQETGPLTADQALALVPGGIEETITVKTPLYRMDISTRGGRVTQWEGFKYDSWTGGSVKLVPENILPTGMDAVFFRGGDLQLGGVVYMADRLTLDLGEGSGPSSLTLTATTMGGLEIRKIFTFRPDTYGVEVDLVVAAPDEAARHSLNLAGSPDQFRFGWNQGPCVPWLASARTITTKNARISRRVWKRWRASGADPFISRVCKTSTSPYMELSPRSRGHRSRVLSG